MSSVLVDGRPVDTVSVFDRGFQYGDGVFETIAVVDGEALFWPRHFERFMAAAQALRLPMPPESVWREEMHAVLCPDRPRQVLKLMLSRGVGDARGYAVSGRESGTRVLYTTPWPAYPDEFLREGVVLARCRTPVIGAAPFAALKSLNRLNQVMARMELSGPEVQEGLMLDAGGYLREGTFTNIFWVVDGRVETPRLSGLGIPGVMRREIMDFLAPQDPVDEVDARPERLSAATECFVCNSLIGIWPVRRCGDIVWPRAPGALSRKIMAWLERLSLV